MDDEAAPNAPTAPSADDMPVRRRVPLFGVLFLVLVAVIGAAFWWSSQKDDVTASFEEYVTIPDTPFTVVSVPASAGQAPYTIASVKGPAGAIALSLPSTRVAGRVLDAVTAAGLDPMEAQVVRTTQTSVADDGTLAPYITISLLQDTGYYEVLGMSPDGAALWYTPPILQLPRDLSTGSDWSNEGLTVDVAPFTFSGTVEGVGVVGEDVAAYDGRTGCLDLRTTMDQQIPGAEGYVVESMSTWCPGLGAIVSENVRDGVVTRLAEPGEVTWPEPGPAVPVVGRPAGTTLPFPIGVTAIQRPPVSVPGALVVLNSPSGDLVEFTAGEAPEAPMPDESRVLWMQHPGGTALEVVAAGDRLLVTTSLRQLQSYDLAGRLRWSVDLPDIASGEPVALGSTVAVALVDGTVRGFASETGDATWTARLSDVIIASPVVAGDRIIAADAAGYVIAVDETGREAWSASLESVEDPLSPLDDGSVLIPQTTGDITLLDAAGDQVWSIAPPDSGVSGRGVRWDDVIVLPTGGGLRGLASDDGEVLWTRADLLDAQVTPGGLATAGGAVVRVSAGGDVTEIRQVQEPNGSSPARLFLATLGGEWVTVSPSGAMTFLGVADE